LQEEEQLRGVVEHKHRMSQRIAELKRQLEESRTATADRTFQLQASEVIQVSR
jgi:predicted RNA-binding protein